MKGGVGVDVTVTWNSYDLDLDNSVNSFRRSLLRNAKTKKQKKRRHRQNRPKGIYRQHRATCDGCELSRFLGFAVSTYARPCTSRAWYCSSVW